jgi:quercetin dioxygenase-like cupin family protein
MSGHSLEHFIPLALESRSMAQQLLHHRGNCVVRRQTLAPGEASPWHRDPYHRVTVVFRGDLLKIEFGDGSESLNCKVAPGEVDWSEPSDRVHRAVNVGQEIFEEVVTFFLDRPDADPQPEETSPELRIRASQSEMRRNSVAAPGH